MFAFLEGTLVDKGRDRVTLSTAGGVGYELMIPESERQNLPSAGDDVILYTHLYVREDRMQLFGFAKRSTREFFRQLLPQKGIGPKLALSILSDLGSDEFRKAVHDQDMDTLTRIKGVGKKTAKRLIVEMSEKLPHPERDDADVGESAILEEATEALIGLGFNKGNASSAVRSALSNIQEASDDFDLEDVISLSLNELDGD